MVAALSYQSQPVPAARPPVREVVIDIPSGLPDEAAPIVLVSGGERAIVLTGRVSSAALWESYTGNPQGNEVMALMAPGTGLGGGVVIEGRLLRGARGMGGDLKATSDVGSGATFTLLLPLINGGPS